MFVEWLDGIGFRQLKFKLWIEEVVKIVKRRNVVGLGWFKFKDREDGFSMFDEESCVGLGKWCVYKKVPAWLGNCIFEFKLKFENEGDMHLCMVVDWRDSMGWEKVSQEATSLMKIAGEDIYFVKGKLVSSNCAWQAK